MQRAIHLHRPIAQIQHRQFTIAAYAGVKTFDKILIANRGEIAVRIMKTARLMGIKTVAVYSDADSNAKHVHYADEAVNIGPAPSKQSYLVVDKIVDAVKKTGAQAVHPGYGFLSENSVFSGKLKELGVKFIGPSEFSIHAMGDKIESKKRAIAAGVFTIPGYNGIIDNADDAVRIAKEIGFPVMVKASGGGGGKGMRIAWNEQETRDFFRLCKQEAMSSFNDDRMFVEKFIEQPRHIEFQVLVDSQGNGVYFPERECSIQRRNQKVIEEAPSVVLDAEMRRKMGEQAIAMAKAVNYESAGTVEFLVDKNKKFYFLEMNTRLQVEHPITELISGQDIVAHMIGIAAGHPLPIKQSDLKINGHALECRVYAEDPFRNYLPSIGPLRVYQEPKASFVRCDSGIREGTEITMYYDPMISKTCTHGVDRSQALSRMREALDTYIISGVNHNIPLLRTVIDHPRFIDGATITTKFLEEEYPKGFPGYPMSPEVIRRIAGIASMVRLANEQREYSVANSTGKPSNRFRVSFRDHSLVADVSGSNGRYSAKLFEEVGDKHVQMDQIDITTNWVPGHRVASLQLADGSVENFQVLDSSANGLDLIFRGSQIKVAVHTEAEHKLWPNIQTFKGSDMSKFLQSPMPGQIKSVAVKVGDKVVVGQELLVVEAMKMQNILRADRDSVVSEVRIKEGQSVAVDEILIGYKD